MPILDRLNFQSTAVQESGEIQSASLEAQRASQSAAEATSQLSAAVGDLANTAIDGTISAMEESGKKKGLEDVRRDGLKWRPEEESLFGFGIIPNVRARASNAVGEEAWKARVEIDVRDSIVRLEGENPLNSEGFNESVKAYSQGITKGVDDLELKDSIELLIQDNAGRASARILKEQTDSAERENFQEIFVNISGNERDMREAANSGDSEDALVAFDRAEVSLRELVRTGGLSPYNADKRSNINRRNINQDFHEGIFDRLLASNPVVAQEYIDKVTKGSVMVSPLEPQDGNVSPFGKKNYSRSIVSEDTRESMVAYGNRSLKAYHAANAANVKVQNKTMESDIKLLGETITNGQSIDTREIARLKEDATETGNTAAFTNLSRIEKINNFLNVGDKENPAFLDRNVQEQQLIIDQLTNRPQTAESTRTLNILKKSHEQAKTWGISDGGARGWYNYVPLSFDDTLDVQLRERAKQSQIFTDTTGREISPMTASEVEQFKLVLQEDSGVATEILRGLGENAAVALLKKSGVSKEDDIIGILNPYYNTYGFTDGGRFSAGNLPKNTNGEAVFNTAVTDHMYFTGESSYSPSGGGFVAGTEETAVTADQVKQAEKQKLAASLLTGKKIIKSEPGNYPAAAKFTNKYGDFHGAFGPTSQAKNTEKVLRANIRNRYAFLAKEAGIIDPTEVNEDILEQAVEELTPVVVKLDADNAGSGGKDYKTISLNPAWSRDEAQENTETFLGNLTPEDLVAQGMNKADAKIVIKDLDGGYFTDYGFNSFKVESHDGGYLLVNVTDNSLVGDAAGNKFILKYNDEVFNRGTGRTPDNILPSILGGIDEAIQGGIDSAINIFNDIDTEYTPAPVKTNTRGSNKAKASKPKAKTTTTTKPRKALVDLEEKINRRSHG